MAAVLIENLCKNFPGEKEDAGKLAVDHVSFQVEAGEFVVLVGPSGCGKSTTLRLIAGLEEISSGTITIDGKQMNNILPKDRDIAMVFQNYALYPHMSVYDNMAFGLTLRGLPPAEIRSRVEEAAATLGLTAPDNLLSRKPKALSGGQRQRVALGRAMVRKPKVFLFDEPLSNLDAKMRVEMRDEIVQLHRRVGATMIYVTHDQVEAMTMADRIVVMNQGRVQQISPPRELYESPANRFVAGFIGSPPMNFLRGVLLAAESGMEFREACPGETGIRWTLPNSFRAKCAHSGHAEVILGIRPEHLHPCQGQTPPGHGILEADLRRTEPIVPETILHLETAGHTLLARVSELQASFREGEKVRLLADLGRASLFCPETGTSLTA